jgi:hypothetical protein
MTKQIHREVLPRARTAVAFSLAGRPSGLGLPRLVSRREVLRFAQDVLGVNSSLPSSIMSGSKVPSLRLPKEPVTNPRDRAERTRTVVRRADLRHRMGGSDTGGEFGNGNQRCGLIR